MLIQNDVKYTNSASLYLLTGNISIFHLSLSLIIQKVNFSFDHPTISRVEHAIPGKNIRIFIRTNKKSTKVKEKGGVSSTLWAFYTSSKSSFV